MAPEVRHAKNTTAYDGPPADIFALGQILFIIHTAKFAFEEASSKIKSFSRLQLDPMRAMQRIGMGHLNGDFIDLIGKICKRNP